MDADVLRLENLDTDLRPLPAALEATRRAIEQDRANSYLPFLGRDNLRRAIADSMGARAGVECDWQRNVIVTAGGLGGILTTLLALLDPGDEVLVTDPIYVGILNRIRLARAVPRFLPLVYSNDRWRLDTDQLHECLSPRTRIVLMVDPSMPTGAVLNRSEWEAIAQACIDRDLLLLHDAAFERIVYDGVEEIFPASLSGMANRVITVGSTSKVCRMIGWRLGWIVLPEPYMGRVARAAMSNTVAPVGIAQDAAELALLESEEDFARCVGEWERRRNTVIEQLQKFDVCRPHGGWSLLVDVGACGRRAEEVTESLFSRGRTAVTPMTGWGTARGDRYVRIVFSNEPLDRLGLLGQRFRNALR